MCFKMRGPPCHLQDTEGHVTTTYLHGIQHLALLSSRIGLANRYQGHLTTEYAFNPALRPGANTGVGKLSLSGAFSELRGRHQYYPTCFSTQQPVKVEFKSSNSKSI